MPKGGVFGSAKALPAFIGPDRGPLLTGLDRAFSLCPFSSEAQAFLRPERRKQAVSALLFSHRDTRVVSLCSDGPQFSNFSASRFLPKYQIIACRNVQQEFSPRDPGFFDPDQKEVTWTFFGSPPAIRREKTG